jgi:hypothetical protein
MVCRFFKQIEAGNSSIGEKEKQLYA